MNRSHRKRTSLADFFVAAMLLTAGCSESAYESASATDESVSESTDASGAEAVLAAEAAAHAADEAAAEADAAAADADLAAAEASAAGLNDYVDLEDDPYASSAAEAAAGLYDDPEVEEPNYALQQARQDAVEAQDGLRRSMWDLQSGNWENDMPTVQRRVRDMNRAAQDLQMMDPTSSQANDLAWEARKMKREADRLESENWRDVVPDLEAQNRRVGWEAEDIESEGP